MPVLGDVLRKSAVSRFTRTLGTLISSGVSILEGLEITAKTAGNRVIQDAIMQSRSSIAGGDTIAQPLQKSKVFPPMVISMIAVGEQTGGLDEMLSKIADFYDDEVDTAVGALTALLEPVMIVVLGVIIGVLPGLGGANGVAILLPLTFGMAQQPGGATSAIILLSCIYWGALFGGAITSILFNIPGEPWSVATTFDGYPLAQKGRAGAALTAAFTSSFVGAFVAVLLITFLSPVVARFALRFGPPEFFAVYLLTFCSFVGMGKGSPFKILASMAIGFALAAVAKADGSAAKRTWP